MSKDKEIYRCTFLAETWSLNYVVYRHLCSGQTPCNEKVMAEVFRVATFVDEAEAKDYCAYRNKLIEKNGSDKLPHT